MAFMLHEESVSISVIDRHGIESVCVLDEADTQRLRDLLAGKHPDDSGPFQVQCCCKAEDLMETKPSETGIKLSFVEKGSRNVGAIEDIPAN